MDITGKITGIKYKVLLSEDLQTVDIERFNINEVSPACLLRDGKTLFAVSKWVSPKRTRSYPLLDESLENGFFVKIGGSK